MVAVPAASAFSPLPELIAQFGLPNPLTYLDQSQNAVEDGYQASGDWRGVAGDLRLAKDGLVATVATVQWQGPAGAAMRQEVDADIDDLERRIQELENSADANDDNGQFIIDLIRTILQILAILVGILAITFAIAMAASFWSFGTSLLVWLSMATGLSLQMIVAITGAIAGVLGILSHVLGIVDTWLV